VRNEFFPEITADRCPYGDPTCPCQDGDMCHYEGPDAMSVRPDYVRIAVNRAYSRG
jgi:hypothetical protein